MAVHFNLSSFPSFSAQAVYAASVPEDLSVHSVVLRVGATDADLGVNAWIQYSLHGLGSHDLRIDPDTGLDNVVMNNCWGKAPQNPSRRDNFMNHS